MQRLRRKTDIHRALREGRRLDSPHMTLYARRRAAPEAEHEGFRLAVIAGRHFRRAFARNRSRRLLRETCRTALRPATGDWDLLLIARPQLLALPFPDRLAGVSELLQRARVIPDRRRAAHNP